MNNSDFPHCQLLIFHCSLFDNLFCSSARNSNAMRLSLLLFMVCVVLFLLETGGANFVFAQQNQTDKTDLPKNEAAKKSADSPVVKQINFDELKAILKQNAEAKRPLMINFWATWCPPCREEFPDLVKIDAEYRPKGLEFVTVSLDDLAEIKRDVPQFLIEMKATMPAFLLKAPDEEAAIAAIAPGWRGALPLTVLYNADGRIAYTKMGAIKPDVLRSQIEKLILPPDKSAENPPKITQIDETVLGEMLKPNKGKSRPLMVYFWATWCAPCRAKFPELVAIDKEFRSRGLDFITISLDNAAEINGKVPKFLQETKASMPAFLLNAKDREKARALVPLWTGGVGTLVLYDSKREVSYFNNDSVKITGLEDKRTFGEILRSEIELVLAQNVIKQ